MPINKNAYLRFRIIDECLRNQYKYFNRNSLAKRLSERLGKPVSVNTVDKDIKTMKDEFDAPIVFNKIKNYYHYSNSFSLAGLELNQEEEDALNLSLATLDILKETKYVKSYKSLIEKIVTRASNDKIDGLIEFEQTVMQHDSHLFDTLIESIKNKEALVITYQVYGKEKKEHLVSPYMIKEYRNRFYLVARENNQDEELIFCFGLDRIKSIKKAKDKFQITAGFDSKRFFENSFGITRDLKKDPIDIVLKFSNFNAPYILSKPLHKSQRIIEKTEDHLTVSIKVFESFELNMTILSYGAGVEVISPQNYKDHIHGVIKDMVKLYKL